MSSNVEVVVSGIGGIFPSCLNLDDFKELLLKNLNTAQKAKWIESEIDDETIYNNMPLKRDRLFDATFFGIHRPQVSFLDPLTRMLLEKTFEAIVDAGVNPMDLRGKNIPVLIGSTISETDSFLFEPVKSGFGVTGQARTMLSNRISYWLNVNGPSISIDANWNNGIQVMQIALAMIQSGICDAAVVGAPECSELENIHNAMKQSGLLSKDGCTRPFDEQADGYSRGDGVVVLFLQRANHAKRNYASVLHASTIFNGSREGDFIGCDQEKFLNFLQQCYADSNVDSKDITYLETYGCGLKNIDEAELAAIERFFCKGRDIPLQIGSVKTNIGHTESASALISLIKIIIAMETGIIAAHLNYNQPNKNIPALTNGTIEVLSKNKEWSGELAAINCIGIGSSYGHMIVRRNKQPKVDVKTDLPILLTYSTRTEEGIEKITKRLQSQPVDLCYNDLVNEVFSKNIPGHLYRGYSIKNSTDKIGFQHFSGNKPAIWFVYSGMGSQWQTMGRDLMKLPVFAEAIYKCHNILKLKGIDLLHIIIDDDSQIFENILNSFVGIAAIQIALTDVLNAMGIQPEGIIGHSVGELGCAYADKCLTAEQMILSAYYRGKASLDADLPAGMMAAVGMSSRNLKSFCPPSIDLACHNSYESCTISGPVENVKKFVGVLKAKGIFARLVNVSNIAYHSRYIKPAAPLLLSYLKDVIPEPKARSSKWLSTSVPQSNWNTHLARTVSPEYLTNNLLSSVLFEETLSFIPDNAIVIEIAPHGLLQAILKRALHTDVTNVALTKKDTNCLEFLFNSLGQLYLNGLNFNLKQLYPVVPRPVPSGTKSLCNLIEWEHGEEWEPVKIPSEFNTTERTFDINLKTEEFQQLNHYKADNRIFIPPAFYFGLIIKMINVGGKLKDITFENVIFKNHVEIPSMGTAAVTILILGSGHFEITNQKKIIVTGIVDKNKNEKLPSAQQQNNKDIANINGNNFYKKLNMTGYTFLQKYELVSSFTLKENGFEAKVSNTDDLEALASVLIQTHLFYTGETNSNILLPKYIQKVNISFDDFQDTTKETVILFNSATNILESNKGIHIINIQYESLETINKTIKIENAINCSETLEKSKMTTYNSIMRAVNSNEFLSGYRVNYLGLHTADLTRIDDANIPCELGALDFAGTGCAGDRVMGLAQTDLEHCQLDTDPAFVWPVPLQWTLCDAATVPYAYTLAYYTLFIVGDISKGDVVLVHAGCSEVGQAALHVAYNYGCIVFTTVENEQQKIILKKLMPGISDKNILNSETTQFELAILQETKGRGVDVVLNCLPGQRLEVSKHLLARYSRFIQLGSSDLYQHATTGTKEFLKCTSFYGITGQHLLQLDREVKCQLHEMISQDIHGAVVVPIKRRIFTENRVDDSLRYLRSSSLMGAAVMQVHNTNYKNPVVIIDSVTRHQNQESYFIYADSQDIWILLVQWLVKNGAKRIMIANQSNQNNFSNQFLSNIILKYDTEIVISKHNASTFENAKSLAKEASLFGYMKEIFIFATDGEEHNDYNFDKTIFKNIDAAFCQIKQNGKMVCILGTNQDNSYIRGNGLPVCNIMWDNTYSVQDVIKNLDTVLTKQYKTNILLKNDSVENEETKEDADDAEDNSMFLPNNLKILILLGQNALEAGNVVQLSSLAPKKLGELPPVFLVPGLAGPYCPDLRQFVGELMYPVFCINLSVTTLQNNIVAHLAQQILQVQQCKVYKLIGVSWGGILAIEIAKHMENLGKKVKLHLIDGDPKVTQNFSNIFNKTSVFNSTLLKKLIKIDGQNLENILTSTDLPQLDCKNIRKSLTILKNLIEYSNFYKSLPNQITGPTTVILPDSANTEESPILNEHCEIIQYKIIKGNHRTILQNRSVSDFINDNLV